MKFYGTVGYADGQTESAPGVWEETIVERKYYGDVVRSSRRLDAPPTTPNSDIRLDDSISILADAYANGNYANMRYVELDGSNWTVTGVQIQPPRLILTIGELWNGNTV
jgi:hypothetical protein